MIIYLDQMVLSNLVKPRGKADQKALLSFLAKSNRTVAFGFHHLQEIAPIKDARKPGDKTPSLRDAFGDFLDQCPITRFNAGPAVGSEEFKEVVIADTAGRPPRPIARQVVERWGWLRRGGEDLSPSSAIASVVLSDRWDPPTKRFWAIGEKDARFRARRKADYASGRIKRPESFERTLLIEQEATRLSVAKEDASWPSSRIHIPPLLEAERRQTFLKRFNLAMCPALNLFAALIAHYH